MTFNNAWAGGADGPFPALPLAVSRGGTGALDPDGARANLNAAGSNAHRFVIPVTVPDTDTPTLTDHGVSSHYDPRLVAATVDGVPTTGLHTNPLRSFVVVEILTLTAPGTLRLTGDSYDPLTGLVTVADTEDIPITAVESKSSAKRWDGATTVVLSSVGGLDCTLDSFAYSPLGGALGALTIQAIGSNGGTSGANNEIRVRLRKYEDGIGLTTLYDETLQDQASGLPWTNPRAGLSVPVVTGEAIIIDVETQRITSLQLLIAGVQDNG